MLIWQYLQILNYFSIYGWITSSGGWLNSKPVVQCRLHGWVFWRANFTCKGYIFWAGLHERGMYFSRIKILAFPNVYRLNCTRNAGKYLSISANLSIKYAILRKKTKYTIYLRFIPQSGQNRLHLWVKYGRFRFVNLTWKGIYFVTILHERVYILSPSYMKGSIFRRHIGTGRRAYYRVTPPRYRIGSIYKFSHICRLHFLWKTCHKFAFQQKMCVQR